MSIANRSVQLLLGSPAHWILSGSTALIRYTGRRSQTTFTTPTQYARCGNAIVIAVADAERKTWWRNFRDDHDVDVLIAGTWTPMIGRTVDPTRHPHEFAALMRVYLARFPRAAPHLDVSSSTPCTLVWCRPRQTDIERFTTSPGRSASDPANTVLVDGAPSARSSVGLEVPGKGRGVDRSPVEEPLTEPSAEGDEPLRLLSGLDALGDDVELERRPEADHRLGDR